MLSNFKGLAIARDDASAYIWLTLAANRGSAQAKGNRDLVKVRMTSQQVDQAEEKVRNWKPQIKPSFTFG